MRCVSASGRFVGSEWIAMMARRPVGASWRSLTCSWALNSGYEKLDFFVSDIREIPPGDEISIQPIGALKGSLFCREGHPLLRKPALELSDLVDAQFASVYMPDVVKEELAALLAPLGAAGFPVVFECESAVATREFIFRTEIGVVRTRHRTLTPASELLLSYVLSVAGNCLVPA